MVADEEEDRVAGEDKGTEAGRGYISGRLDATDPSKALVPR